MKIEERTMLRKLILATFAAASFGGAILVFATPASAYGDIQFEYTKQDDTGAAGGGLTVEDSCVWMWYCF
jgi:hypothetical protein